MRSKNDSDFLSCSPIGGVEFWPSVEILSDWNKLPTDGRPSRTELLELRLKLRLRSRSGQTVLQLESLKREGRE